MGNLLSKSRHAGQNVPSAAAPHSPFSPSAYSPTDATGRDWSTTSGHLSSGPESPTSSDPPLSAVTAPLPLRSYPTQSSVHSDRSNVAQSFIAWYQDVFHRQSQNHPPEPHQNQPHVSSHQQSRLSMGTASLFNRRSHRSRDSLNILPSSPHSAVFTYDSDNVPPVPELPILRPPPIPVPPPDAASRKRVPTGDSASESVYYSPLTPHTHGSSPSIQASTQAPLPTVPESPVLVEPKVATPGGEPAEAPVEANKIDLVQQAPDGLTGAADEGHASKATSKTSLAETPLGYADDKVQDIEALAYTSLEMKDTLPAGVGVPEPVTSTVEKPTPAKFKGLKISTPLTPLELSRPPIVPIVPQSAPAVGAPLLTTSLSGQGSEATDMTKGVSAKGRISLASRRQGLNPLLTLNTAQNSTSADLPLKTPAAFGPARGRPPMSLALSNAPPPSAPVINTLQPPRLNISNFFSTSSIYNSNLIPDSPMSAGGPRPGSQLSMSLATDFDPRVLPAWFDRIAALGPTLAPVYIERMFKAIEETERIRLRNPSEWIYQPVYETEASAKYGQGVLNPFSTRISGERGNLRRNRYTDIVPYEWTRVVLRRPTPLITNMMTLAGQAGVTGVNSNAGAVRVSDYINASYIDLSLPPLVPKSPPASPSATIFASALSKSTRFYRSCKQGPLTDCEHPRRTNDSAPPYTHPPRRYISAQAPLPETVPDFWAMVWDESTRVVVSLTREEEKGRVKCHRFWPERVGSGNAVRVPYADGGELEIVLVSATVTGGSGSSSSRSTSSAGKKTGERSAGPTSAGSGSGETIVRELRISRYAVRRPRKRASSSSFKARNPRSSSSSSVASVADTGTGTPALSTSNLGGSWLNHNRRSVARSGTPEPSTPAANHARSDSVNSISSVVLSPDGSPFPPSSSFLAPAPLESRTLWQVHFLGWPDHKSSDSQSVLNVVDLVNSLQDRAEAEASSLAGTPSDPNLPSPNPENATSAAGPIVVHCSAGCGRTGTFLAIDVVLSTLAAGETRSVSIASPTDSVNSKASASSVHAATPKTPASAHSLSNSTSNGAALSIRPKSPFISSSTFANLPAVQPPEPGQDPIFDCVSRLREQRVSMVQTLDQFAFVYEAVATRMRSWAGRDRSPVPISTVTETVLSTTAEMSPNPANGSSVTITWEPVARPSPRPPQQPLAPGSSSLAAGILAPQLGTPGAAAGDGVGGWTRSSPKTPMGPPPPTPAVGGYFGAAGGGGSAFNWDAALKLHTSGIGDNSEAA
ncbi:hypothetical protein DFJ73DRAFT_270517 [Zopfochytrium polystomum]|nr:hypothetical protein DFJ73DRAFT_270517 [Zopfochytrium polystomum]